MVCRKLAVQRRILALVPARVTDQVARHTIVSVRSLGGLMKFVRSVVIALALSVVAVSAFALSARATTTRSSCFSADYCFCLDIGCYMGDLLCASSDRFVCYQS